MKSVLSLARWTFERRGIEAGNAPNPYRAGSVRYEAYNAEIARLINNITSEK